MITGPGFPEQASSEPIEADEEENGNLQNKQGLR